MNPMQNWPVQSKMQVITDIVYSIDNNHQTVATVRPGEVFKVNLMNAFGKSFESEEEFVHFFSEENQEEKKRLNHPCTGPIAIDTDEKNISLAIHILDAKVTKGYQCLSHTTGFLKGLFQNRSCQMLSFNENQKLIYKDGDLIINTRPKIGFVATIDNEVRSVGRANSNGGNLDLNYLGIGNTIYLPVNSDTPRILIGDLHACQGNGEAAGIAVEADGEVTLKIDICDKINFPIIDNPERFVIAGWGASINESLRQCVENSMDFLKRVFPFCDWSDEDIYKMISAEGNLVLGNSTGKVVTCGMVFLKKRFCNKYGLPILH